MSQLIYPDIDNESDRSLWKRVSAAVLTTRMRGQPEILSEGLQAGQFDGMSAESSNLHSLMRYFSADNAIYADNPLGAADRYSRNLDHGIVDFAGLDLIDASLAGLGEAYRAAGKIEKAIEFLRARAQRLETGAEEPLFEAAQILLENGEEEAGRSLLEEAVASNPDEIASGLPINDLARRELRRLDSPQEIFFDSAKKLASLIERLLDARDGDGLVELASPTHFSSAPGGGCRQFEETSEPLLADLQAILKDHHPVVEVGALEVVGDRAYLSVDGLIGEMSNGLIYFMLTRCHRGWEWSGLVYQSPTRQLYTHWKNDEVETNQPLRIEIDAPWPPSRCFMAGGLWNYIGTQASLASLTALGPFGLFLKGTILGNLASRRCGFGPRGFYYNEGSTHKGREAFAIDFTRYRNIPYLDSAYNTPVLSCAQGIVSRTRRSRRDGDPFMTNSVYLQHRVGTRYRYESRYLHLSGPNRVLVSSGMFIRSNFRIGYMDDTGNSALHHLHFVIRDMENGWKSVRPTPMGGTRLDDSDGATCICAKRREVKPWDIHEPGFDPWDLTG